MTDDHEDIETDELDDVKIPWHFWIAIVLVGLYLAFRFVQLIILAIRAIA